MSIGSHTFWIIVKILPDHRAEHQAVTVPGDARQSAQFRDCAAAIQFIKTLPGSDKYFPVAVRS